MYGPAPVCFQPDAGSANAALETIAATMATVSLFMFLLPSLAKARIAYVIAILRFDTRKHTKTIASRQ